MVSTTCQDTAVYTYSPNRQPHLYPFVIKCLSKKGIYIEAYDSMNLDHRAEQKLKRLKRRNFVAKNNKHRAKRHASIKQYTRKPKYQGSLNES